TAVLYPKSNLASPRERSARVSEIVETEGGYTPEAEALLSERDIIAAPNADSQTLQAQEDQYQQIGTPEERGATSFYYSITFGSARAPVSVGGKVYTPNQLQAMDDGDREALANLWAEETGNTERIE